MPRPLWTGAISFGLVSVPVKLYSALDRKTVRFHQLSGRTGVRIAQKRIDPQSGEEVPYDELVKGFEISPDRYVVIEPGELETLAPRKSRSIEIEEFVELAQIDPVYYDHPYYLAPAPGGAKPYTLLLQAMTQARKVAIARVVIRSKESLVAVRPMGDALGMSTMIFADEILPADRLDELAETRELKTTKRELDIAVQLVQSLSADFEPAKYHDTYREEVLALIERKAQGKEIAVAPAAEELRAPAPDLMSALKASLDAVRARDSRVAREGASKPRRAAPPPKTRSTGAASAKPGASSTGAAKARAGAAKTPAPAPARRTASPRTRAPR